jgi:transcriptional regulator with XRE-family HTH domain
MGILSDELAKVVFRKRRGYRFTQDDLGHRIGVSGSYISGIELGKTSPRLSELEDMAAHFRTTAMAMLQEAAQKEEGFVPAANAPRGEDTLDAIAADLSPAHRRLAREFLIFLRERERVDRSLDVTADA